MDSLAETMGSDAANVENRNEDIGLNTASVSSYNGKEVTVCDIEAELEQEEARGHEGSKPSPKDQKPLMDIEMMLKIPQTFMFPLELSRYLKEKLTTVVEDNWHLTKHINAQEYELCQLRRQRDDPKSISDNVRKESPTLLSTKIIDLSKKNRDMSAQIETLKNKMQAILAENEGMKRKLSETSLTLPSIVGSGDAVSLDGSSVLSTSRTDATDISAISQQLNKTTGKMMEYRRQNQLLQIELRTALRALAQEVGDGANPKTILREVAGPDTTWRGRQQQILTLTQKVSELQFKLSQQCQSPLQQDLPVSEEEQGLHLYHIDNGCSDMGGGGDTYRNSNIPVLVHPPGTKRQVSSLHTFEKKKHKHMENLGNEVMELRNELKASQLEAKGSKARTQFLESQVRSLRIELDEAGLKLRSRQESLQQTLEELKETRQELLAIREREKKHRETSNTELQEANQALARERSVVVRLQKLISEKQEHLQKLDSKVARLQDSVHAHASASTETTDYMDKIKSLENQLQLATQSIHTAEKERERLLTLISNSVGEAQQERQSHCEAERLLSRSFAILNLTDTCINRCLDAGQVTNKGILEEVEEIRALVRELKAGTSISSMEIEVPKILPQSSKSAPFITLGTGPGKRSEVKNSKEVNLTTAEKSASRNSLPGRQLNSRQFK